VSPVTATTGSPRVASTPRKGGRLYVRGVAVRGLAALEQLAGGLGTAAMALLVAVALAVSVVLCVVGVGLVLVPLCLRGVRALTERERSRLTRWGYPITPTAPAAPAAPTLRAYLVHAPARREISWLAEHATLGFLLGFLGVLMPVSAVRDLSFVFWWRLLPEGEAAPSLPLWTVTSWAAAFGVAALGLTWVAAIALLGPGIARLQAAPGRLLLTGPGGPDLSLRVAELTATRAAALDAHATELRRIERSLHDGTQNRLVAVTVLLGTVRQALAGDPSSALAAVDRAQDAAEAALADLRSVARTILPPVLSDRGLRGALHALAADSPVPCHVEVDVSTRCAAAVEATAYFTVAEALTNTARHSSASRVRVTVRRSSVRLEVIVEDDGVGGANDERGSGLLGIRRRAEALDGTMTLHSPEGGPTRVEVDLPCGS